MRTTTSWPSPNRDPYQPAKNTTVQYGPSLLGCVFLVFLTLRLCGVIDWHWGWVTAPLWGPPVLVLSILLVIAIVASLAMLMMFCYRTVLDLWRGD